MLTAASIEPKQPGTFEEGQIWSIAHVHPPYVLRGVPCLGTSASPTWAFPPSGRGPPKWSRALLPEHETVGGPLNWGKQTSIP